MSNDRPLTRRQLRELERARRAAAAAGAAAAPAAAPGPEPEATRETAPEPTRAAGVLPLTRRQLREIQAAEAASEEAPESPGTAEDRSAARRPVLAPATTGNTQVVDPSTGAMGAVTIDIPAQPAAAAAEEGFPSPSTPDEAEDAAAGAALEVPWLPVGAGSATSGLSAPSAHTPSPAADQAGEPVDAATMTVEQAAIARGRRSGLATAIRYIVLVLAAFLIGILIWIVAERATAAPAAALSATVTLSSPTEGAL